MKKNYYEHFPFLKQKCFHVPSSVVKNVNDFKCWKLYVQQKVTKFKKHCTSLLSCMCSQTTLHYTTLPHALTCKGG